MNNKQNKFKLIWLSIITIIVFYSTLSFSQEAKKIQDNSFLIEEAYNQEDRVVQHIQYFNYNKKAKTWEYNFTQEWPFMGQTTQLSYSIPFSKNKEDNAGLNDIALNYRYQLIFKDAIALAPRLSLIIPTGDYKKGYGSGGYGLQMNIPLSVELSDKWVTHWNLGSTYTIKSKAVDDTKADTLSFNYGTSVIYCLSENFNLMFETVYYSEESVTIDKTKERTESIYINPGFRFAINLGELQIVPGLAFPIGIGPSEDEYNVFLYISFEHPF